jgi:acetate kinase
MAMEDLILVVNSGSSSISSRYNAMNGQNPALLLNGQVEGISSAPQQSLTCIKSQSAFADSFSAAHSRPTFAHLAPS